MKKTIAIIGSAAAFSFAGAGIATAQDTTDATTDNGTATETTETETAETQDGDDQDGEGQGDDSDGDDTTETDTPEEVSTIAQQLCGTVSAYDFLGSVGEIAPGLSGEECEANADKAVEAAQTGDIAGALDILRGIDSETPDEGDDTGSAEILGSLGGDDAGDDDSDGDDSTGDDDSTATEGDDVSQAGA